MACLALVICKYHVPFPDPKYLFVLLLTLSVPSVGYWRNAYMMWGFWCDCSLFLIAKELLRSTKIVPSIRPFST
jgi:hypothetical protein